MKKFLPNPAENLTALDYEIQAVGTLVNRGLKKSQQSRGNGYVVE